MKVVITGKHVELTKSLKEHIEEKIDKLDKFHIKIVEAHVILTKEKYFYVAEVKIFGKKLELFMKEKTEVSFIEALDKVIHKVEVRLGRQKDKLKGHHQGRATVKTIAVTAEDEE